MIGQQAGTDLVAAVLFLLGGGSAVAAINGIFNWRKTRAEADDVTATATTRLTTGYGDLLDRLVHEQERQAQVIAEQERRLGEQGERIAHLEGALSRTAGERNWWRARALQFEELLKSMKIPVPQPVPLIEDDPSEAR